MKITQKEKHKYRQYFYFIIFLATLVTSFLVIKPLLTTILGSIVAAYLFYPLYKKVHQKLNKTLAATLVALLLVVAFTVPMIFFVNAAITEANVLYVKSKAFVTSSKYYSCGEDTCLPAFLQNIFDNPQFKYYFDEGLSNVTNSIVSNASSFLLGLPFLFLNIFIALILTFFLLRDGHVLINWLRRVSPFDKKFQDDIFQQLESITSAVIHGQFLVALIIGTIGGVMFWVVGLPSPVLWGFVMAILSFLPVIGSPVIWVPAGAFLIIGGMISNTPVMIWKGIGVLVFGIVVMSVIIENTLKPRIVGEKANVHPVVILLGLLGGISLFGLIGIVVGPIVLALLITFLDVYERDVV